MKWIPIKVTKIKSNTSKKIKSNFFGIKIQKDKINKNQKDKINKKQKSIKTRNVRMDKNPRS